MSGPDDLAHQTADWMTGLLEASTGQVAVALSGGSTPKRLYMLLALDAYAKRIPWDRVHWFWGDERFVPPDDPASNYRMTREALFDHVPVPDDHVHPIRTVGLTPEESARAYEAELRAFGGDDLAKPLFLLVLLGLGTNGHFASLFPGTASLTERKAWVTPVTPEGEKTRITLTYPALESCQHAAFLVAGADKRDVLAEVRAGKGGHPASSFRPQGELHWLTDSAAAGR